MNILITGGAGYLGYELTKMLLLDPSVKRVTVYDNFLRGNYHVLKEFVNEPKIILVRGDILDTGKLEKCLAGVDVVCHLAAVVRAPYNEEFTHLFEQTNHWGTASLCAALEKNNAQRLIYISSGAVYGVSNQPFSKDNEPNPASGYGHSKLNGEKQLERVKAQMNVTILRLGNVFGYSPAMHFGSLINKFNLAMRLNEPLLVHGCGNQIRPFIHIQRVIKSIYFFLTQVDYDKHSIFNIYDFNASINDIIQSYRELSLDFELIYVNRNQRLQDLSLAGNKLLHEFIGEPLSFTSYIQTSLL